MPAAPRSARRMIAWRRALKAGGASDGPPGPRPHYYEWYYAAFIRDPDGNRIEAVTFVRDKAK